MQNVIYAVIGVILTVAAMYMVAPSINSSSEAIKANLVATEVSAIKNASKMWLANESKDGTYKDFNNTAITNYLPELKLDGSDFQSKAGNGVKFTITKATVTTTNDGIQVVIDNLTTKQESIVRKSMETLTNETIAASATGTNTDTKKMTVKIKG